MGDRTFHDIICVPSLLTNLLLVFYATHTSFGKQVEFILFTIVIREMHCILMVIVGEEDQ